MHAVIVANGELPVGYEKSIVTLLANADLVIAADGGLRHCRAVGRWPDALVGDLDSAPDELVHQARAAGVAIRSHPKDKNATDLELALEDAVGEGATSLSVVAPFGGRLDHELATIALLSSPRWQNANVEHITATDGRRQLSVVQSTLSLGLPVGQEVSLIPWNDDVTGVITTGLQWPLVNETLPLGTTRGVSNVASQPAQAIAIASGTLLVVNDLVSAS